MLDCPGNDRIVADPVYLSGDAVGALEDLHLRRIREKLLFSMDNLKTVVDVGGGLLEAHRRDVVREADTRPQRIEMGVAEKGAQLRLTGKDEGDAVAGV